jgi:hypothetical protein
MASRNQGFFLGVRFPSRQFFSAVEIPCTMTPNTEAACPMSSVHPCGWQCCAMLWELESFIRGFEGTERLHSQLNASLQRY